MGPKMDQLPHPVDIPQPFALDSRCDACTHGIRLAALQSVLPPYAVGHVQRETGRCEEDGDPHRDVDPGPFGEIMDAKPKGNGFTEDMNSQTTEECDTGSCHCWGSLEAM